MAISFVNRAQGGDTGNASTIVSPAASHTAGNLLVMLCTYNNNGGGSFSSVSDTAGNTWNQGGAELVDADNNFDIYYAFNCAGNAANVVTVVLTGNAIYRSIVVLQFSGILTTDPLNDSDSAVGSGTAIATPSLTVTASQEVICALMIGSAGSKVAGSGFTLTEFGITGDVNPYFADEYKIVTASQAANASQASGNWAIKAAAFKTAASATVHERSSSLTATASIATSAIASNVIGLHIEGT